MTSPRPPFDPVQCETEWQDKLATDTQHLIPVVQCSAHFPQSVFSEAITGILYHPEYNSSLILRADVIEDSATFPHDLARVEGFSATRILRRRILARNPNRDGALEQKCVYYAASSTNPGAPSSELVTLTPCLEPNQPIPFYHPRVRQLAFRYVSSMYGNMLCIYIIPLEDGADATAHEDPNSRLYRTCLALLETVAKRGWGKVTGYKKRVVHDTVIDRSEYQDLYLIMRELFKSEVGKWQEATDAQKHVFEDIGIATFLMLLWKYRCPPRVGYVASEDVKERPWEEWPRPQAGFTDLGCGNGLLVHILVSNGYDGRGVDVRSRKSWSHYPASTQERLLVRSIDPTALLDADIFPKGSFIVGNHADEMTPWVHILATLLSSDFLSIPCCAWDLDQKLERRKVADVTDEDRELKQRLGCTGTDGQTSAYAAYVMWLAKTAREYKFDVECEALRIPSTRNWALIGKKQQLSEDQEREVVVSAEAKIDEVRRRGVFKTRAPEGKVKDH